MLEKPNLPDARIVTRLKEGYGLAVAGLTFLPLGADINTAVYRVTSPGERVFFLKLRRGIFDEITVRVPGFLNAQGIHAIIAPLEALNGQLWIMLDDFSMVLYPFIEGLNGYEAALSDTQWLAFGAALHAVHAVELPSRIARRIPREHYAPDWRQNVKAFQAQVEHTTYRDPAAAAMAAVMCEKRAQIDHLVMRADQLAARLRELSLDFVLCHTDIHPGNLLIPRDGRSAELYIVDWDNPMYAPKEHDLMMIGGSNIWNNPAQNTPFFRGYFGNEQTTPATINPVALTYYRYERIVQDIAAFGEQLFGTDEGGPDRDQAVIYFKGQFLPNHEVDIALATDQKYLEYQK